MLACVRALVCVYVFGCAFTAHAGAEQEPAPCDYLVLSAGAEGVFDATQKGILAVEYRFSAAWHGVRPWLGANGARDNALFVGGGAMGTYAFQPRGPLRLSAGFGPGYYKRNKGLDLGARLEFLSFVELGYVLRSRHALTLKLTHISNCGISKTNPGVELVTLGFAIPLR